jgi:hypothetical protein
MWPSDLRSEDQDRENFETAVRLRRLLENESATAQAGQAVPVFVWLPGQPALAGCLREETGIVPFGECRTSASYQEITQPLREKLGQAFHAEHERHNLAPSPNPHPESWKSTRDDYGESSRAAADHALIKLAAIGKTLQHARSDSKNTAQLVTPDSPEETRLAQMEHNRWLAERLMTDWRYAATGEDQVAIDAKKEQRLNQTMTPWENLSEYERDKDVRQVRVVLNGCAEMVKSSVGESTIRQRAVGLLIHASSSIVAVASRTHLDHGQMPSLSIVRTVPRLKK